MPKKSKRNIKALLAKRAELQQQNQKSLLTIPGAPSKPRSASDDLPEPVPSTSPLPDTRRSREIWRSLGATAVIAVVLVVVVATDRRTPYLTQFGDRIYNLLRLGD